MNLGGKSHLAALATTLSVEALTFAQESENLTVKAEVIGLAQILVAERVMPGPAQGGDAVHVAAATIHGVDYILSWNLSHLSNPNKIMHLRSVCLKLGMIPPRIVTPDLLWGGSDEQESEAGSTIHRPGYR